jgi:hypothetical protein
VPRQLFSSHLLGFAVVLCTVALAFRSVEATAGDNQAYLQTLLTRARENSLANERLWHLLLHYKPHWLGGVKSEADGSGFFFHPRGQLDPQGELEATLAAFFVRAPTEGEQAQEWQHPQCRFPARYDWLKAQLAFDPSQLPEQPCPRFEAWREALNPGSVTLIFASYYLSNPASMFGHTLLRLNHTRRQGSQNLLDYGINYAAITTTQNGILFAILGITGGFEGRFANFPYYLKVQEYSNLESRDVWEYDLQFTHEQIDRMVRHLWELGSTYFWYYFFQENCSYHILSLLEVANPQLHLTDRFLFTVIPADTVRLITRQQGLVGRVIYRPSLLSQFTQKRRAMQPHEVDILQQLLRTKSLSLVDASGLDVGRQRLVLDAAIDIVQHQAMARREALTSEDQAFRRQLFVRRSQLGAKSPHTPHDPLSTRPELGHGTSRLRLAVGADDDEGVFVELSYPSFHDLLDPEEGFPPHSHIALLTPTVRYYPAAHRLTLERFDAVGITSLSPLNAFFRKVSWRVDIGYQTLRDVDCGLCHWWKAEAGAGMAVHLGQRESNLAYAFFNVEAGLSKAFEPDARLSPGVMVGATLKPLRSWTVDLGAALYAPIMGGRQPYYRNHLRHHLALTPNLGVRVELNQFKTTIEGLTALHIYF